MSCPSEYMMESDDCLEAACDGLLIRTGRQPRGAVPAQPHDDHRIIAPCINAAVILRGPVDGAMRQARASDRHVALVPAGQALEEEWTPLACATTILVRPHFLRALVRANGRVHQDLTAQHAAVDPFMWHMVRSIEIQIRARRVLEKSFVESIAMVIGQHLLSHHTGTPFQAGAAGGLPAYKVRSATDYVREHYQEDIGFKDIAEHLQMSPFHFARMFKHSTGESPHQFIMRCRIDVAKKLLIEGERGIADIALEVGYKSQSYFTTRFAQFVGATPAAFRTAH